MIKKIALLYCLLLVISCRNAQESKTIKLAHSLSTSHPVHDAMLYMSERLAEISNNELTLEIYPSSQLGSDRQCLELLQIGSLGMTTVTAAVMENFSPNLRVLSYPYLFRDNPHRFKVYDGDIGQQLLLDGEKYWLRGLTFFDAGNRSFYTKTQQIQTPEDLKGLKIRVIKSPTAIEMVKTLGGSPAPISWGELYTALQQGVVDGAENNLPSFHTSKHYEVCKFITLDEHTSIPDVLTISTLVWKRLSDQEKEWLMTAVKEATVYQREAWAEAEKEAMTIIKEAGVEVTIPDKSAFENKAKGMIENLKTQDEDLYNLAMKIKAVE